MNETVKNKRSVFQRLKQLILGKEKPNLLTRISVIAGFLIWIYLVSWQLLTLLSILLMGSLKQAELVERSFIRVGSKLYGFADAIHLLTIHTFAQLAAYSIILFALILIWRKKKIGFLFYVFGNVAVILSTLFILGTKYFSLEITYTDLALIGSSTLYFGIGAVWMYRSKLKVENKTTED